MPRPGRAGRAPFSLRRDRLVAYGLRRHRSTVGRLKTWAVGGLVELRERVQSELEGRDREFEVELDQHGRVDLADDPDRLPVDDHVGDAAVDERRVLGRRGFEVHLEALGQRLQASLRVLVGRVVAREYGRDRPPLGDVSARIT